MRKIQILQPIDDQHITNVGLYMEIYMDTAAFLHSIRADMCHMSSDEYLHQLNLTNEIYMLRSLLKLPKRFPPTKLSVICIHAYMKGWLG